ncbi:MAG: toxin YoeB [Verrucomicrobiales bacterium]|jgi:toxin YoeB
MKLVWMAQGWNDYIYWQENDIKILRRINQLIRDTLRSPFSGIGKPKRLKRNRAGWWSRRINDEHRFVYRVEDDMLIISQCRFHYDD